MRNLQRPPLPLKNFSPSRVLPRLRGPDPDLVSSGLPAACTKQECSLFLLPRLLAGRCHSSAPENPEVWRSGAGRVGVSKPGWGLGRARVLKADTVQHSYLSSPDQLPSCDSSPIPPPLYQVVYRTRRAGAVASTLHIVAASPGSKPLEGLGESVSAGGGGGGEGDESPIRRVWGVFGPKNLRNKGTSGLVLGLEDLQSGGWGDQR